MPDKFGNPTPEEIAAAEKVIEAALNPVSPPPVPPPTSPPSHVVVIDGVTYVPTS
jgi:hypothetical protein